MEKNYVIWRKDSKNIKFDWKRWTVENTYLIKKINVSEATIRRDLDHLEKKENKRVRGGGDLSQIEKEEKSISDKTDIALGVKT